MIYFYSKKPTCRLRSSRMNLLIIGLVNAFGPLGKVNLLVYSLFVSPRFSGHISRFLFDSDRRVLSALVLLNS